MPDMMPDVALRHVHFNITVAAATEKTGKNGCPTPASPLAAKT
jgi:hypothetical protein